MDFFKDKGCEEIFYEIVPDDIQAIRDAIIKWTDKIGIDIIITTGGTGLYPRDVTPEAVRPLLDREIPGISEILRIKGYEDNPNAILSRSVSGIRKKTLVITLPGSVKAVKFSMDLIFPVLEHAVMKLQGDPTPCGHQKE